MFSDYLFEQAIGEPSFAIFEFENPVQSLFNIAAQGLEKERFRGAPKNDGYSPSNDKFAAEYQHIEPLRSDLATGARLPVEQQTRICMKIDQFVVKSRKTDTLHKTVHMISMNRFRKCSG